MIKFAAMLAVIGAGLFLGVHESPNNGIQFINSADAALIPLPGVFALLGIGGLAMAAAWKHKK